MDAVMDVSGVGGNKICAGAVCDFSDSKTNLKDAKERSSYMRKLVIVSVLCIVFMAVEVVGGLKAHSLAILTDAAHLLSDVLSFAISLFSLWAAGWEATPRQSYGFFRIEILGALISIQMIWILAGILVYEAIARIIHDSGEVQGSLMFAISAFGLAVNILMTVLLGHDHGHGGHSHDHGGHSHNHADSAPDHSHHHDGHAHDHSHDEEQGQDHSIIVKTHIHHHSGDEQGHAHDHSHDEEQGHDHSIIVKTHIHHHSGDDKDVHEPLLDHSHDAQCETPSSNGTKKKERNINVHSAYLHALGDSIQSIGVMIGGAVIWYKPEWKIIDLICTLIFSVIVLLTTFRMLGKILEVLMESTPREIDATRLETELCEMDGVVAVHELHIWAITVGKVLLACHVTITPEADADYMLDKVIGYIRREHNISHLTIQIERH